MNQESIPNVSTMSERDLRTLFEHMRINFPGTLMAALLELGGGDEDKDEDDVSSQKTQKSSNTKSSYEKRHGNGGPSELKTAALVRNSSDVDGGDLPPSVPTRPDAEESDTNVPHSDVPLPPALISSASKQMSSGDLKPSIPTRGINYKATLATNCSEEEGCYLVYDSDGGKLIQHYSTSKIPNALAFWAAGEDNKIKPFKFKQNAGRSELIGNCQSGVAGRKNFYSGWCQFIRAGRALNGSITMFPLSGEKNGLPVDVFVYLEDEQTTVKLEEGTPFDLSAATSAVACLPKHTSFYEGVKIDSNKWMTEASNSGAASRF